MMLEENYIKQVSMIWGILLLLLTLIAMNCAREGGDAYWHIKVGEWIFQHYKIPETGIFSYTKADSPWVSHEWLSAILIYQVFYQGSWAGLVLLILVSVLSTSLVLLWFLLKRLRLVQSLIFMLFAYLLMLPHILPRPHVLAIPVMTYWTACLIEASERQTPPSFYLLPWMVLWANLHGSFIIGIAFSVFFGIEAIVYSTKNKRRLLASRWCLFVVISSICASITPHGFKSLLFPFQLGSQTYTLSVIKEWLPPDFHQYQPIELWLLSFLGLCLFQGIKLPPLRIIFLLGLLHLSLKHARHAADLLSVLTPLALASPFAKHFKSQSELDFKKLFPTHYKSVLIFSVYIAVLCFYLINIRIIEPDKNRQVHKVLSILKTESDKLGNVLNSYYSGNFLIFNGFKVYVDPRAEIYGDAFMKEYLSAISLNGGAEKLDSLLSQYQISWTLFETDAPINTYLTLNTHWLKLYSDNFITIFIRQPSMLSSQIKNAIKEIQKKSSVE